MPDFRHCVHRGPTLDTSAGPLAVAGRASSVRGTAASALLPLICQHDRSPRYDQLTMTRPARPRSVIAVLAIERVERRQQIEQQQEVAVEHGRIVRGVTPVERRDLDETVEIRPMMPCAHPCRVAQQLRPVDIAECARYEVVLFDEPCTAFAAAGDAQYVPDDDAEFALVEFAEHVAPDVPDLRLMTRPS